MSKRKCAYCGKSRDEGCRCIFSHHRRRLDRKDKTRIEVSNISIETNLDEFIESIRENLPISIKDPKKAVGVWRWTFVSCE